MTFIAPCNYMPRANARRRWQTLSHRSGKQVLPSIMEWGLARLVRCGKGRLFAFVHFGRETQSRNKAHWIPRFQDPFQPASALPQLSLVESWLSLSVFICFHASGIQMSHNALVTLGVARELNFEGSARLETHVNQTSVCPVARGFGSDGRSALRSRQWLASPVHQAPGKTQCRRVPSQTVIQLPTLPPAILPNPSVPSIAPGERRPASESRRNTTH